MSGPIGLLLGGVLTEYLSWRWCLYVNLIFAGIAAAYLTSATLAHARPSPQLTAQALIHGYAAAFWWSAAILAGGALIALALFRNGPLTRPSQQPQPSAPARATATPTT